MDDITDYVDVAAADWQRHVDGFDTDVFSIGMRVRRLGTLLIEVSESAVQAQGFAVLGDYEIAAALLRSPRPLGPSDLAQRLRVTRPGVSGRLDRMSDAGLVRRIEVAEDRRSLRIELTQRGVRQTTRAFGELLRRQSELLQPLTSTDRKTLGESLRMLLSSHDPAHR